GFGKKCCSKLFGTIKGPSVTHSILFGIFGGLTYYGSYYLYRYLKITYFDTMHVSNESRRRYMEKQMLFYNDMGYDLSMKYIGNLCQYYDPVALRLPFQPLDDKYRL
ncbi:ATP synthase-associated protein, putative, partial [Hepatocystis sp. ex Piliocolobus tephrosceles]